MDQTKHEPPEPTDEDRKLRWELLHLLSPASAERALLSRGYLTPVPRISHR